MHANLRRFSPVGISVGTLLLGAIGAGACTTPPLTCESLDTLTPGTTIAVGAPPTNSFQPPLMDIAAHPFTWFNGGVTTAGFSRTETGGLAGGSGVELQVNNVTLSISRGFGQSLSHVRVAFGEYGGNLNVHVGNAFVNVDNFAALHGKTVGGVTITVLSGGAGNDKGVVEFAGTMPDQANGLGQVAIGGQELWLDDICFAP